MVAVTFLSAYLISLASMASAFIAPYSGMSRSSYLNSAIPGSSNMNSLVEPSQRDANYGKNIAQYLVDLHDNKATFDFCGGMMFQLVLTDRLRNHLVGVASGDDEQPKIYDASKSRMFNLPNYVKNADADNIAIFHGRELRKIPDAAGGMGFVLQLSMANDNERDPEGWSPQEISGYDGWGPDSGRQWRNADVYEAEGFKTFKDQYGPKAFGLHHRFYLHFDNVDRMWLSAEDGCEGTPSIHRGNPISRMFGF